MSVDALMPWALSVALLSVRLTVGLALSPMLSAYGVPAMVRVALVLALAALAHAHHEPAGAALAVVAEPAALLSAVFAEVLIGALLGLGVHIVMAGVALAGRLLDLQVGFGIGAIFDPTTRSVSNVLASLATLLGVTLFMVSDGPVQLARLIADSITLLPLGVLPTFDEPLGPLLAAGEIFALGTALAAPVVAALLLTDVVIAVASRNMPQVNVLILAMPVKVIVGYLMLVWSLAAWAPLLQRALARLMPLAGAA